MHFLVTFLLLASFGAGLSNGQVPLSGADSLSLFVFTSTDEGSWRVVNDGVMGGRSKGYAEVEEGVLQFSGRLVTQGGGFTSLRTLKSTDLSDYDGLELRVRGGGRTFEIEVSDGARFRGRSVSRRSAFETTEDWKVVRVPFSSFRATIFGQSIQIRSIDLSKITSFGLYIADGLDGAFRLEVDAIWAYQNVDE